MKQSHSVAYIYFASHENAVAEMKIQFHRKEKKASESKIGFWHLAWRWFGVKFSRIYNKLLVVNRRTGTKKFLFICFLAAVQIHVAFRLYNFNWMWFTYEAILIVCRLFSNMQFIVFHIIIFSSLFCLHKMVWLTHSRRAYVSSFFFGWLRFTFVWGHELSQSGIRITKKKFLNFGFWNVRNCDRRRSKQQHEKKAPVSLIWRQTSTEHRIYVL